MILLAVLEAIAEGSNNSECYIKRNTKNSITYRTGTHTLVVSSALDELESKGLISRSRGITSLYEITEKGEQYRMLIRRERSFFDRRPL